MTENLTETPDDKSPRRDLPGRRADRRALIYQASSVLTAIVALTIHLEFGPAIRSRIDRAFTPESVEPAISAKSEPTAAEAPEIEPPGEEKTVAATPEAPAEPKPSPPPPLDRAAIAKAEAALDAASRDRARSEVRAADATRLFNEASQRAALETSLSKTLAFRVRDPSAQITRTISRGGFIRSEKDKLEKEVAALRQAPRAKATSIISRTPVSKVARSDEFHFELRHERVSYINLTQLLNMSKADAQVRLRLSDRLSVISSKVGPVGDFSLSYVLARSVQNAEDLLDRRSLRYDLRGWEVIPLHELRGETLEMTRNPISQFARAIGRISPGTATITLWIYPDSFGLFRQLRDDLASRGYTVAARPLPEGMSVRGSPMGSLSAAQ